MEHLIGTISALSLSCLLLLNLTGCESTSIEIKPANTGNTASFRQLEKALLSPGPVVFKKHLSADWSVPLSGLVNLDHPAAIEAQLQDRPESIQIYTYSLSHPIHGTYLVDSGVSERFDSKEGSPDISWLIQNYMNLSALKIRMTTASIKKQFGEIKGVFLTHIHLDHIMGLTDLTGTPVYIGPGDAKMSRVTNVAVQGTSDRLLANTSALLEWQFDENGIVDIFGDGSVWAIHSPGHSPGSTAYIAMTTEGPQLMLGDVTHTRWGWINGVEPGRFSDDIDLSKQSLARLRSLAKQFPDIQVHPGHQSLSFQK